MIKIECVQRLPRKLVADHLDVDLIAHAEPDSAHEVLVNPRLKLTHPASMSAPSRISQNNPCTLTREWSCPPEADHLGRQACLKSERPGTDPAAVPGPSAGPSAADPSVAGSFAGHPSAADPFAGSSAAAGPFAGPWGFAADQDRRWRRNRRVPVRAAVAVRRPRRN